MPQYKIPKTKIIYHRVGIFGNDFIFFYICNHPYPTLQKFEIDKNAEVDAKAFNKVFNTKISQKKLEEIVENCRKGLEPKK